MRSLIALALFSILSTGAVAAVASEGGAAMTMKAIKREKQMPGGARPVGDLSHHIDGSRLAGGARPVSGGDNDSTAASGGARPVGGAALVR
jgi:hypothetical protein